MQQENYCEEHKSCKHDSTSYADVNDSKQFRDQTVMEKTVSSTTMGSSSITLPDVYPDWLREEVRKNDYPGWKFEYDKTDPILCPGDPFSKYQVRPIRFPLIYELYKKGEASHWTAEEMDLTEDKMDWKNKLNEQQRKYIKKILVYFLSADSGVGENALTKFCRLFPHWNINQFYLWQAFNESIHSETYATLLENFVEDEDEKLEAFRAIQNDDAVSAKAATVIKWVEDETRSPHENLVAFGFTESIFFSGSFTSVGWLKVFAHAMEKGLVWSNDKISADEGLHCQAGFAIYYSLKNKLPSWRVYQMCVEFVEKEFIFIEKTLDVDLIGMNSSLLKQYIMFVADVTLRWFGYSAIYNVKNPFHWMDKWSMDGITSFFEKRNTEYQLSGVMTSVTSSASYLSGSDNDSKKRKSSTSNQENGDREKKSKQDNNKDDFVDFRTDVEF